MAVTKLASSADVVAALGRNLTTSETARVDAILDKASELFRREAGQTFTAGSSTNRLQVRLGEVWLPKRPVATVTSVYDAADDTHTELTYTRFEHTLTLTSGNPRWVVVAYTHGGTVPDIVRLCVADVARKVLEIDPNAAQGRSQFTRTAGPFTESSTYATWAQGGQTMLAPDDVKLARSFRPVGANLVVLEP
jgi:hypothetical protein